MTKSNLPVRLTESEPEPTKPSRDWKPFLDFGNRQTWVIIGLLFLFSIVIAGIAYLMPHGRVAEQPTIHVY